MMQEQINAAYSYLNASIGFLLAARQLCPLTVNNAIPNEYRMTLNTTILRKKSAIVENKNKNTKAIMKFLIQIAK